MSILVDIFGFLVSEKLKIFILELQFLQNWEVVQNVQREHNDLQISYTYILFTVKHSTDGIFRKNIFLI